MNAVPIIKAGLPMRPERMANATLSDYPREQAVIELARKGDANAFEQLYTAHKGRVYSLCVRMTRGNTSLAEDLTQEVFVQVYRKIQSFRGESAFSTWLHRVTVNAVLMRLRKPVVPEVSLEELQPEQEDAAPKVDFGSYDLRLEGVIDRARLERAIDRLAEGYHTIFVLHDIYGYDHKEIAEILGCSIGNSKSQLHKARISIRRLLTTGNTTYPKIKSLLSVRKASAKRQSA
jgi:RNA polymerase sigma-70 factor, ECF subfamily